MSSNVADKPYAQEAGRLAIADHLARRGIDAAVSLGDFSSSYRTIFAPLAPPLSVSMIMPLTACGACDVDVRHDDGHAASSITLSESGMVALTVKRLLALSSITPFELIVICPHGLDAETRGVLQDAAADARLILMDAAGDAVSSEALEIARRRAKGDLLFIVPEDMEPLSPGYLDVMAGYFSRHEVGAVTPRIFGPDSLFRGMGVTVRPDGSLGYVNADLPAWDGGFVDHAHRPRDVQAAPVACLMARAAALDACGGFGAYRQLDYVAVDSCLRLGQKGLLTVYTPYAEISCMHSPYGSLYLATDGDESALAEDKARLAAAWRETISRGDRFYSVNVDPYQNYFNLK